MLLQFGYFNRKAFASAAPFFDRLRDFLQNFAARLPLACEIRNKHWLSQDYFDLLRSHEVTAALVEHAWLPPVDRLIEEHDVITGPLAYVRLISDRHGIEKITTTWGKEVVDRGGDLERVAGALRRVAERVEVVDSHTEGEPTRVVIEGWPLPDGATMTERRFDLLGIPFCVRQPRSRRGL